MSSSKRRSVDVTVVIAAHNESANIEACIASVDWAAQVIVVENDSSDDTVDRARAAGATVINPPFTTTGASRNHGIERCDVDLTIEAQIHDVIYEVRLRGAGKEVVGE